MKMFDGTARRIRRGAGCGACRYPEMKMAVRFGQVNLWAAIAFRSRRRLTLDLAIGGSGFMRSCAMRFGAKFGRVDRRISRTGIGGREFPKGGLVAKKKRGSVDLAISGIEDCAGRSGLLRRRPDGGFLTCLKLRGAMAAMKNAMLGRGREWGRAPVAMAEARGASVSADGTQRSMCAGAGLGRNRTRGRLPSGYLPRGDFREPNGPVAPRLRLQPILLRCRAIACAGLRRGLGAIVRNLQEMFPSTAGGTEQESSAHSWAGFSNRAAPVKGPEVTG